MRRKNRIRCMVNYSSGLSSWAAAWLWAQKNRSEGLVLVFADVFMEDEDNYRFLIEGAAAIFGLPFPDCAYWDIPEIWEPDARKERLKEIAYAAMKAIPGLVWIWEGRNPWELMRDVRLLGNSQKDPCSDKLKRKLLTKWMRKHCDPVNTEIIIGINWDESERMDRVKLRNPKWRYCSPLIDYRVFLGNKHKIEMLEVLGIYPPRMYGMGFSHANCGGFCVKAGHGHFRNLLKWFPRRYDYHEGEEREIRGILGDVTILKCTRGVKRGQKPNRLTLEDLRKRIEREDMTEEEKCDLGGCTCALPL